MRVIVEDDSSVDLTHSLKCFGDAGHVGQVKGNFRKLSQNRKKEETWLTLFAYKFILEPCTFCHAIFSNSTQVGQGGQVKMIFNLECPVTILGMMAE